MYGGGGRSAKKEIHAREIKWKIHACRVDQEYTTSWQKKYSFKGRIKKKFMLLENSPPPVTFLMVRPLLKVVSIPSHVFFISSMHVYIHQKSTSAFARKREMSNWSVQRSKSQVIGCPTNFIIELPSEIVYSFEVFQILTYITLREAKWTVPQYRKGSSLPNTVSQKAEKPHTAGLDDTAIP